jgi:hypothetical protein
MIGQAPTGIHPIQPSHGQPAVCIDCAQGHHGRTLPIESCVCLCHAAVKPQNVTGRYKIYLNSERVWEPEKRTAKRWSLFVNTCRLLANDGLNYTVTFALNGDQPYILILSAGSVKRRCTQSISRRWIVPTVKAQDCAVRAQEAMWFLPEHRQTRNADTQHWRRRGGRYAELEAMAEEQLRAEVDFWREMELLSGQRQRFKPGLTDETAWADDQVAA